ncbi:Disintegrin and metalloproteinase domain-containing protein 9 [Halotydeus destructor]|nr:Disintegrin and metalloproteinase domain-containing protein 9 [Halotydeus destructor]
MQRFRLSLLIIIIPCVIFNLIAISECNDDQQCSADLACGFNETRSLHLADSARLQATSHPVRYIRVYVIGDYKLYTDFFKSKKADVQNYFVKIMIEVNDLFSGLNMHVQCVGLDVWTTKDNLGPGPNMRTHFNKVNALVHDKYRDLVEYDALVFITGHYWGRDKATGLNPIGLAGNKQICDKLSAVDVMFPKDDKKTRFTLAQLSSTIAHEVGHLMGMYHDDQLGVDCKCPEKYCIMYSKECNDTRSWSQCSRDDLEAQALNVSNSCYLKPNHRRSAFAICGNGLIEKAEQCDCTHQDKECQACCVPFTCEMNSRCVTTTPAPVTVTTAILTQASSQRSFFKVFLFGLIVFFLGIIVVNGCLLIKQRAAQAGAGRQNGGHVEMEQLIPRDQGVGNEDGVRRRTPGQAQEDV